MKRVSKQLKQGKMGGASKKRRMKGVFSPINSLPPECVSHIISLTSPRDACMFSLTSTGFRSVADSDDTWLHFLPSDIDSILSRAVDPVVFSSKKDLFVKLCEQPVLIDEGKLSFELDISSGKKSYMISARALDIACDTEPRNYLRWISLPDSRFVDVAEKTAMCFLNVVGKIDSELLSRETRYAAYLVYKVKETSNDLVPPQYPIVLCTSVTINRHKTIKEFACNDEIPQEWWEAEIGEFYIENGEEGEIKLMLAEICGAFYRTGLIIQGIDIRPKH
ncbi:F-box family protein [Rhynchospora pubera]|uniref:F-box family protein n=1 Tax=Rhynchospora pubera TaxID=906938 RepID=A0AAV8E879_9POAL|nr:F-box family protein [Rhynchospora pubera]